MLETIREFAKREWAEVKRVPATLLFVAIVMFGGGWYLNELFHAERFAIMERQVANTPEAKDEPGVFGVYGDGITTWTSNGLERHCSAEIAGVKLVEFAESYYAVLVCGVVNPDIDRLADRAISISTPFNIDPQNNFTINLGWTNDTVNAAIARLNSGEASRGLLWHQLVLLPKKVNIQQVQTLADAVAVGGKLHSYRARQLYEHILAK